MKKKKSGAGRENRKSLKDKSGGTKTRAAGRPGVTRIVDCSVEELLALSDHSGPSLLQFALFFFAGASGAWMLNKRRRPGIRELGILVVTLTILWAAAITRAVPRWGILRSDVPLNVFARRTTYAIFAILDAALVAGIFVVRRLVSKERTRT